ncbi:hypothetical protein Gpo141_00005935 [Globisporangium polare]
MRKKQTVWRLLLLAVNIASTLLTLFTGLKENPVLVLITSKYALVRSRLIEGRINYDNVRDDLIDVEMLVNLTHASDNFRFISAPRRSPANLAEDRSTCMRVNSINASMLAVHYNDFWGYGPRRTQMFAHSISAPRCKVVNLRPDWFKSCVQTRANASECHRFILDNFDELQDNRVVQVGIENDFGVVGVPFLKCLGRPERMFDYMTDLMVQQSYWAGGSYHLEIQSSRCLALPLLRNSDLKWGLFQVQPVDKAADVFVGVDSSGWFAWIVNFAFGIISLVMIIQGVLSAIVRSKVVLYLPKQARFLNEQRYLRYILPSMSLATMLAEDDNSVIHFKGALLMASDTWLNHWLYIAFSMLEALVNVRLTYVVYGMGTWMLKKQINFENFLFVCTALTRMTWIMCFVHSLLRLGIKVALHSLKTLKLIKPRFREKIEWYVDASALFLSFKLYSILMGTFLYMFLKVNGSTTLMKQQVPGKRAVLGGLPGIAKFWGNEIICDNFVILSLLLLYGITIGTLILCTKYRLVASNGLIQLLQQRYLVVGWDIFVAMEALGIDPFNDKLVLDNVARTNCSIGCVLQQLYSSGPSGLVQLAGDYIFTDGGFSKEPVAFAYAPKKALMMGLVHSRGASKTSTAHTTKYTATTTIDESKISPQIAKSRLPESNFHQIRKSIYEQNLQIYTEGRFGKILLIDAEDQGNYQANAAGLAMFTVHDTLTTMSILDIKHLLGNEKKLRIA